MKQDKWMKDGWLEEGAYKYKIKLIWQSMYDYNHKNYLMVYLRADTPFEAERKALLTEHVYSFLLRRSYVYDGFVAEVVD